MKDGKLLWSRIGKILFPFICQLESDSHYVWKEEQLADSTCSVSSNCKILDSENAYLPSFDSVVFTTAGARNCRSEWWAGGTWALRDGARPGLESE